MSERASTREQFDDIVSGQRDLSEAAFKLQAARDLIVDAEKHLFACERFDGHLFTAQAKDAIDSGLAQLTVEVQGE